MTQGKNRNRDPFSFANINLLGRCNADCFFCLGKDIEKELAPHDCLHTDWGDWKGLDIFLDRCRDIGIRKLYLTGQNTDPLLYGPLASLIDSLQRESFDVGIRTNGYEALAKMPAINLCREEIGYSVHTLSPVTSKMVLGRKDVPDWGSILDQTVPPVRVSIVLNRCNESEFWSLARYLAKFPKVRYVQVRRVSTDTRAEYLAPDVAAYERVYTQVRSIFEINRTLWGDADEFLIHGKPFVFWRTVRTTVNSINYFTDGTISDEYFIVEGYLKHRKQEGRP